MKYALTCLAGPTAMGLVALAPDTASRHVITMGAAGRTRVRRGRRGGPGFGGGGGADQGSASMSARATDMGVMLIFIVPITTVATPMRTARGGGTVTVIGTSESPILGWLSPLLSAHGPGGESV
jgi:hypothetical protein